MSCCCCGSSFSKALIALALGAAVAGTVVSAGAFAAGDSAKQGAVQQDDGKPDGKSDTGRNAPTPPAAVAGDPYSLDVCFVASEKLGADAVTLVHESRELRFCCSKCVGAFKADPAKYLAELDKKIIAQQKPGYPLKTCIVMPEEQLVEGEAVDLVYNNRLLRMCCKTCVRKFQKDPASFLKKLDEAVIAAQKPTYALATCPVSSEKLGAHGDAVDLVIANRLVRLCCKGCIEPAKKDVVKTLAALDAAAKK